MIFFKTIKWSNFLSTGNAFTTIQLDKKPTNLIVGENGSGKSTLLDAICFALFGKAYRNINKPQLVNTINNKNCRVEIEFAIGNKEYKVIRGLKPALFEIWVDGKLLNQDAASKDYQKYLEDSILKLNYKSFTQIVILGSTSFTPFMQLPAAARREVIEDILDIKIFSAMNVVLKDKVSSLKEKMGNLDTQITIAKNKAELQQQFIKTLQEDRENRILEIKQKIENSNKEISQKRQGIEKLDLERTQKLKTIKDLPEILEKLETLSRKISTINHDKSKLEKEINFYETAISCPKCKQHINEQFKQTILEEQTTEKDSLNTIYQELQASESELRKKIDTMKRVNSEIDALQNKISNINSEIKSLDIFISRLQLEKNDIIQKVGNIEQEKEKLKQIALDSLEIAKQRSELNETQHYYDIASVLLKDSGIKTKIIKQYLPIINKLVNTYLTKMDFFVQFTLDEKFDEIIKSRYRDDFSYESFSEGEKQRIDLALLFTWRKIAKLKNSASTNLLILDEVFDSSLDAVATDLVMNLLNTIGEDTNVWVISHKGDLLFDKFSNIIKFKKKKNFSVIIP